MRCGKLEEGLRRGGSKVRIDVPGLYGRNMVIMHLSTDGVAALHPMPFRCHHTYQQCP